MGWTLVVHMVASDEEVESSWFPVPCGALADDDEPGWRDGAVDDDDDVATGADGTDDIDDDDDDDDEVFVWPVVLELPYCVGSDDNDEADDAVDVDVDVDADVDMDVDADVDADEEDDECDIDGKNGCKKWFWDNCCANGTSE